jgi:hypothetical protein
VNALPDAYASQGAKNAAVDTAYQLRASGVSAHDLTVEMETLGDFKKKVDAMLQSLDSSDASEPKISQQNIDQGHVGTGFDDATNLLNAYNVVHQNLQTLSQTLSDQIQAMSIALNINMVGYQNVEDSQRQALWKIHQQTDAQYNSGVSPTGIVPPMDTNPAASAPATADSSSSPSTPNPAPIGTTNVG